MTSRLDIFWSFRSPYSYLAVDRLKDIVERYQIAWRFRPVRPLAMREPGFFERNRPQFLPYLFRDVLREGERLQIPFAGPRPDPILMDMATGKVDPVQPIMTPLMGLAVAAVEAGRGLEFAQAVSRRIWRGVENWHLDPALGEAAAEAGLELSALEDFAARNAAQVERVIAENEAKQMLYHWGVPLMVLDEEPFFGQDRLDSLVWRLDQKATTRR